MVSSSPILYLHSRDKTLHKILNRTYHRKQRISCSNSSFKGLRFVTKVPCAHSKLDPVAQERTPVSATLHYRILPKCNKMAAGAHKMAPSGSEDHSSPTTHTQSRENLYQWFLNLAVQDNHRMFWNTNKQKIHVLGPYSDLINLKTPWDTIKYPLWLCCTARYGKHWPTGLKTEHEDSYLIHPSKEPGLKGMPCPMSPRSRSPSVSRSKAASTLEKSVVRETNNI